uniref:Uncharacterized protein n=1 Tax=Oryza brachyantha TaxID=4533 RepID=J3N1S5_ORYBR
MYCNLSSWRSKMALRLFLAECKMQPFCIISIDKSWKAGRLFLSSDCQLFYLQFAMTSNLQMHPFRPVLIVNYSPHVQNACMFVIPQFSEKPQSNCMNNVNHLH